MNLRHPILWTKAQVKIIRIEEILLGGQQKEWWWCATKAKTNQKTFFTQTARNLCRLKLLKCSVLSKKTQLFDVSSESVLRTC